MTLDQLMAFTVTDDHARQGAGLGAIKDAWSRPYQIRPHAHRDDGALRTSAPSSSVSKPMGWARPASSCATCSSPTMAAGCRCGALLDRLVAES